MAKPGPTRPADQAHGWTFLSNYAHVIIVLAQQSDLRLRDVAERVGITERAVQLILGDLESTGYVRRTRTGRRNEYDVLGGPLRHPLDQGRAVDDVLDALDDSAGPT